MYTLHRDILQVIVCITILHIVTEENEVMAGVQRRFPQVELMPAATESEMIRLLREWRQEIRDSFGISLNTIRIDSCINGYGTYGKSFVVRVVCTHACVCAYVCVCVSLPLPFISSLLGCYFLYTVKPY